MKAIVRERYGSPDVLELRDVPTPAPGAGEVLVKVQAASVNDWDLGLLRGDAVNRVMFGLLRPKVRILGSDVAGSVEAVGASVSRYRPGDEVYGDLSGRWGGFAQYACVPERMLAPKPAGMSFVEAAAIPQAALLALQALRRGGIRPGAKLLVNGAGGGVGTFAVQIARAWGAAEVAGVDHPSKLDLLRALGFDRVVDYTCEDFTKGSARYDLILDVKTQRSVFDCLHALAPGGTYVTVGGSIARLLEVLPFLPLIRPATRKSVRILALAPNEGLAEIGELFEAGKLKVVIDGVRPLAETADALRRFATGLHRGKIVVTPGE